MRLLFVEDEPDLREVLKKQLQGSGYSVDACGDGLEALDYLQLTAYDAVILDIMLPPDQDRRRGLQHCPAPSAAAPEFYRRHYAFFSVPTTHRLRCCC